MIVQPDWVGWAGFSHVFPLKMREDKHSSKSRYSFYFFLVVVIFGACLSEAQLCTSQVVGAIQKIVFQYIC